MFQENKNGSCFTEEKDEAYNAHLYEGVSYFQFHHPTKITKLFAWYIEGLTIKGANMTFFNRCFI